MYPFKVLNKKKFLLCFINAFLENVCLYMMPLILSIFLSVPFSLEKFKWLIICTIIVKVFEILFNALWGIKVNPFLEFSKKDLQISYFKRLCNMNISRINNTHTGYLKKQLDIVGDEAVSLLQEILMTINGFFVAVTIFLFQVWTQSIPMFFLCIGFVIVIVIYNIVITKANVKIQEEYNDTNAKYNATAVDFLQNVKIVKNFDALNYATNTMERDFEVVKKPLKKAHIFDSIRFDGINALVHIMYVIILVSLFIRMQQGENVFSYLVFYASMFEGLRVELSSIASLFQHYNKFKSANNQIEKILIEEEPQNKIRNWSTIALKDVAFKYKNEGKSIIKISDFLLEKNDKVSIVGDQTCPIMIQRLNNIFQRNPLISMGI